MYKVHVKIVHSGTIVGGEEWSTSYSMATPGIALSPTQGQLDLLTSTARADFATRAGANGGTAGSLYFSAGVSFVTTRGYSIGADGKATLQSEVSGTATASTTALALPPQCSLVVSLRTGLPGRARRGRMYLPSLGIPLAGGNTGRYSTGAVTSTMESIRDHFEAMNAVLEYKVCVASNAETENFIVTSVQADNVVDTQRRRRDSQVGTVVSALVD